MAFVLSPSPNSTSEVPTVFGVSIASPQVSTANLSDATVYAFLANQPNGSQLMHEDLKQIHEDDQEEMDLKWQLALQSMRAKIFFQKTECQGIRRIELGIKKPQKRTVNVEDTSSKATVAINGAGFDWSYMADDETPTNMASMALLDLESDLGYVSYNVVPPPHSGRFSPLKIDLSHTGLPEFAEPSVKSYEVTSIEVVTQTSCVKIYVLVKENIRALLIEDWKSDEEDEVESPPEKRERMSLIEDMLHLGGAKGGKITGKCTISTEKGIKREYSISRTPQQNKVADRRNKTLIEAARTMLADSKLPITFWAEAVNTACYVQNRVLVVKPYFKTPYELFRGRTPALSFTRPFGCHVTLLNTLDHLGKFDGKSDEGLFVGYSTNSDGPKWLFDIDTHTESTNYIPVSVGTNFNDFAGKGASFDAGQSSREEGPSQDYILTPLWNDGSLFDSFSKDSDGENPDTDASSTESKIDNQESLNDGNSTKNINTVGPSINTASLNINIASPIVNTVRLSDDYFGTSNDIRSLDRVELDISNLSTTYHVPTTLNTRINKDHSLDNVIGDMQFSVQTIRMTVTTDKQGFITAIYKEKTHVDLHTCLFSYFLSQKEPKRINSALKDPAWVEAMQEELLQFHLQRVWTLVDLPRGKGLLTDVKSAFLYGRIKEEVCVCQPPGFEDPDILIRSTRGKINQTLFIKRQKEDILLIQVYVDDIIFRSTKKELCTEFEVLMHDKFQMSSIGELTFILGLQVKQNFGVDAVQDFKKMHQGITATGGRSLSPQVVAAAKLPILNPNEFDLWKMRIEQYFLMPDYSLWEVILNGDSPTPTRVVDGQRLAKKNELNARGTLLMALPNKHQLKFNIHKDAKSLMKAIEKSTNESVSVVPSVSTASTKPPASILPNVDNLSNVVIYSFFASQYNSPQLDNDDLKQIDADDLEEMDLKWQMAMLTIRARRFLQRIGRNLGANGTTSIGFDMSKVECYNYHRRGHFAREYRLPRDTRNKDTQRRNVLVETFTSNALVSQCLESVEARLVVYQQNENVFEEDIKLLKLNVMLRDNALVELRKKFEQAEKERDELKHILEKFQTYSRNLCKLLESQIIDKPDVRVPTSPVYDRYKSGEGYHAVPPPYKGTFMPPKPDLVFHDAFTVSETVPTVFNVKPSTTKPNKDMTSIKPVEHFPQSEHLRQDNHKSRGHKHSWNRKACFVCKSVNHLIKDCDYYAKKIVQKPVWNHAMRVNHQNSARMTHPYSNKQVVPTAVLTRSRLVPLNAVRPVTTVVPQTNVNHQRPAKHVVNKPHLPIKRPINHRPTPKNSNFYLKVTTIKPKKFNVVQGTKGNWVWKPKCTILDHVSKLTRQSTASFKGKSRVYLSTRVRDLNDEFEEFSVNSTNRFNAASATVTDVGPNSTSSTNSVNVVGPSDNVVSPNFKIGFEDPDYPNKVYKVVKVLYGLHQAPRAWYKTLANYLLENGFQRGKIDQTLFIKKQKVKQKDNRIFISKDKYVANILRKFGLIDGKSASTPIDTKKPLLKDPDGEDVDVHIYRLIIGSLMYLTSSRPDIMSVVYACAHFQVTPKVSYLHAVKRIFRLKLVLLVLIEAQHHISNESPLLGVNTPRCDEDSLALMELMIVDFLNAHPIQYALMVNPTIYVLCIKKFWASISIKKSNDAVKLQALINRKKCMSAKRTAWNEFSSSMASAVICLATGDLSSHNTTYTSLTLTHKVFSNMRRIGKGFSGVETPLFDAMLVPQQVQDVVAEVKEDEDENEVLAAPFSPTPATTSSLQQEHIPSPPHAQSAQPSSPPPTTTLSTADISTTLLNKLMETCATLTQKVANLKQDKIVQALKITKLKQRVRRLEKKRRTKHFGLKRLKKVVLSMHGTDELEPAEVEEVIKVVIAAKLMTEVVTTAAPITIAAQVSKPSALRKRRGVVIQDPEETVASVIVHSEVKPKDKGKGILIEEPKPLKMQAQNEQDEAFAR
uniref:Putative ribonuclease H-like domain-containing protein n=1 Tax=Tanacetum cinerariifolium TaxID=118510 RepID=A0A6L2LPV8_TANCI|nr:putative ribonuclease H-like domain-containing protein [Tanacetum cinerariifolium]